jgi:hypothetical protein
MTDTEKFMKQVGDLHQSIAADVWPKGGGLWCRECGHHQPMTTGDAGRYLATGWPKCCSYTMTIDHPDTWKVPVSTDPEGA